MDQWVIFESTGDRPMRPNQIVDFQYDFNNIILSVEVKITFNPIDIELWSVKLYLPPMSDDIFHNPEIDLDGIKLNGVDLDVVLLEEAYHKYDEGTIL